MPAAFDPSSVQHGEVLARIQSLENTVITVQNRQQEVLETLAVWKGVQKLGWVILTVASAVMGIIFDAVGLLHPK